MIRAVLAANALWDVVSAIFVAAGLPNLHTGMWRGEVNIGYVGATMTCWFLVALATMRAAGAMDPQHLQVAALSYAVEGYMAFTQILAEKVDFVWGVFVGLSSMGMGVYTANAVRWASQTGHAERAPRSENILGDEAWT